MKCEKCHKAEATEVVRVEEPDVGSIERFVCKKCAKTLRAEAEGEKDETSDASSDDSDEGNGDAESAESEFHEISADAEDAPPFLKDFLNATMGLFKGLAEAGKKAETKCPKCGRTLAQCASEEFLGCPVCWTTFGDDLAKIFLRGAYGTHHCGEAPAAAARAFTRASLERQFKSAMKKQDFRKAAELKAKLDALDAEKTEATEENHGN